MKTEKQMRKDINEPKVEALWIEFDKDKNEYVVTAKLLIEYQYF